MVKVEQGCNNSMYISQVENWEIMAYKHSRAVHKSYIGWLCEM